MEIIKSVYRIYQYQYSNIIYNIIMYILINNNIFHSIVNTITYFLCDTVYYFYYEL